MRSITRTALTLALAAASLAGPAAAQQLSLGTEGGSTACAPGPETLKLTGTLRARGDGATAGGRATLRAPGGGGTGDSYHCCDADGTNCSGSVDALTICPVIKVRCREEDNACICD